MLDANKLETFTAISTLVGEFIAKLGEYDLQDVREWVAGSLWVASESAKAHENNAEDIVTVMKDRRVALVGNGISSIVQAIELGVPDA